MVLFGVENGGDGLIERLAAFGLRGPIAGPPAGRHRLQLQAEGPREQVAAEIGRRAAGTAEVEDAVAGVPKHGELLHAEEAAAADLVFAAGLDRLAGLLPLDLGRPAAGVVGRQGGKFKLQPRLANGGGNLVRIDADRTIQGLADDVLFQAELEIQQMLAGQEADARLLGRGGNLADGELLQDLDVAGPNCRLASPSI